MRVSDDAGRYLCNYTLYESLRLAHTHNNGSGTAAAAAADPSAAAAAAASPARQTALFVHVPPFDVVPRARQLAFVQARRLYRFF